MEENTKEREILKFNSQIARSIVNEDHEDFDVIETNLVDSSRWSLIYEVVIQRKSDGKYFHSGYSVGATEGQDERAYEYDNDPTFGEVFKVEKTITVFE